MDQKGLELPWCIINLSLLPETSSFSVASTVLLGWIDKWFQVIFGFRDYLFSNVVWRERSRSDEESASPGPCLLDHEPAGVTWDKLLSSRP